MCYMKCAYCEAEGKMSREHVIPKGFIEHMNTGKKYAWLDKAPTRLINAELTVKDVCAVCNNGELSLLDSYGLKLILKYNEQIFLQTKKIYFKYDYDMLARWLLKVCYNSARANDTKYDIELYEKNVDYIMNKGIAKTCISVFAMYIGTSCFGEEFEQVCQHIRKEREYEIDWFRIAPFRMIDEMVFYCASRCIIINSFAFLIVVCDKEHECEEKRIKDAIIKEYPNAVELKNNGKVWLKREEHFLMDSLISSRQLRDSFLRKRTKQKQGRFLIVSLTKEEIENKDFSQLQTVQREMMSNKDDLKDCYQSLIVAFEGYENEVREPYQSKAFQSYFRNVFDNFPEIIWALFLDEKIVSIQAMIWAYVNENYTDDLNDGMLQIKADRNRAIRLLETGFDTINRITNYFAFDFSINKELSNNFEKCFFKALPISEVETI